MPKCPGCSAYIPAYHMSNETVKCEQCGKRWFISWKSWLKYIFFYLIIPGLIIWPLYGQLIIKGFSTFQDEPIAITLIKWLSGPSIALIIGAWGFSRIELES